MLISNNRTYVLICFLGGHQMNKQKLCKLIDKLNDWQLKYLIKYIEKMFNVKEDD